MSDAPVCFSVLYELKHSFWKLSFQFIVTVTNFNCRK